MYHFYPNFKRPFCLILFLLVAYIQVFASIDSNSVSSFKNSSFETPGNLPGEELPENFSQTIKDARITDQLRQNDIEELPVGIKHEIGNITYTVAFYKATFTTPDKALLAAVLQVLIPGENGKTTELYFAANNIEYTPSGGISNAQLMLISSHEFNLGKHITLRINGGSETEGKFQSNTYATIDCSGFKKLQISGDVILSREVALPVDGQGNVIPQGQITIPLEIEATDFDKLLLSVNVPQFSCPKLPGFVFSVNNAVIDFSEEENSTSFNPPAGYESYLQPSPKAWKGLYIGDFSIRFPQSFSKGKNHTPLEIEGKQLIIDSNGLTVNSSVKGDLLPLSDGNASGWPFSVNEFNLKLLASQLNGVGFGGQIMLPVSDVKALNYAANLSNGDWMMNVSSTESIDFNIWKAQCELDKNSTVTITLKDGKFLPEANLNGRISIETSLLHFSGLTFEGLKLKSEPSYISVKSMGYNGGEIKLAALPITVSKIAVTAADKSASLSCHLALNLDDLAGFTSDGDIRISGKLDNTGGRQKWKFDNFSASDIHVKGHFNKVSLAGTISIRENDPIYGNGFAGDITMTVVDKFEVKSHAVFGRKEDTRYWAVDGSVTGISIPMAGFSLTGFGGGISKHMARQSGQSQSFGSGLSYIPDATKGLSLMASTFFIVPKNPAPLSGEAGFSIIFGASGGLERLGFFGNAQLCYALNVADPSGALKSKLGGMVDKLNVNYSDNMKKLRGSTWLECREAAYPEVSQSSEAKIYGSVGIGYDFTNNVLDGNMEVFVNAGQILHGIGSNNLAGRATMHFDFNSGAWYIYIGQPDYKNRVGLESSIAGIKVKTNGYFDIGTTLPPFPGPPQKVIEILNQRKTLYTPCPMDAASTGGGIAFGAGFDFDTGDLTFAILYARFAMGAGFDVMLKNYGREAHCEGETSPVGINGWYARGQAYAYLTGDLGIRLKIFGLKKRFSIIKGSTAALLEAGLPNPTWFKGAMAGEYSLMGNAIRGHFDFKFKIGDACKIEGASDPFETMQVIADISPANNSTDVSVFAVPQVTFNIKMNDPVTVDGLDDGTGEQASPPKTYRFSLTNLQLEKDGKSIAGTQRWNTSGDVVVLDRPEILPGNADLELIAELKCEERVNGVWKDYTEDGKVVTERKSVKFKTGAAPDYIPWENVQYMYPVKDQQRYYVDESHTGYVKLKMSQYNILPAPAGWTTQVNIRSNSGWQKTSSLSLSDGNSLLSFDVSGIAASSIDSIKIINTPPAMNVEGNVSTVQETKSTGSEGNDVTFSTKKTSGTVTGNKSSKLLDFGFAASSYRTFAAKIDNVTNKNVNDMNSGETSSFNCWFSYMEPFDRFELQSNTIGGSIQAPLIKPSIVLDDNYFLSIIKPRIYNYITGNLKLDRGSFNNPPTDGVYVWQTYFSSESIGKYLPFIYDNPAKYYNDRVELINKSLTSNIPSEVKTGVFQTPLRTNDYKMKLQYVFPNGNTGTSKDFIFHTTY